MGSILKSPDSVLDSYGDTKLKRRGLAIDEKKLGIDSERLNLEKDLANYQKLSAVKNLQDVEREQAKKEGWGNARKLFAAKYNLRPTPKSASKSDALVNAIIASIQGQSAPNGGTA